MKDSARVTLASPTVGGRPCARNRTCHAKGDGREVLLKWDLEERKGEKEREEGERGKGRRETESCLFRTLARREKNLAWKGRE